MKTIHTQSDPLTEKEKQIIYLICDEYTTPKIAATLGLSVYEVTRCRKSIKQKIHYRNTVGIVLYAIQTKIYNV